MIGKKIIGIIDEPNPKGNEDKLGIKQHASALIKFIKYTPTPITIGIQGEWGSGKTSLLNSIFYDLEKDGVYKQIWINSWENSLLSTPEEALLNIINEIIKEMIGADKDLEIGKKITRIASNVFKGALRVSAAVAGGVKVGDITDELLSGSENSIKSLRAELENLSNMIRERAQNPYDKIVIYVDDLDRIEPKDAVKVLELLKNIFSISNCVFILAIDYQVVVKGLEHKFGKRTDENEWEFRAFFDKIIQLPFMMPMGQYNIGGYVSNLLEQINFIQKDNGLENAINEIIVHTIGGNPRSLKRLVNSIALISIFLQEADEIEDSNNELDDKTEALLLFSLVCLQISFPKIHELLTQKPDFPSWSNDTAFEITKLAEEKNKDQFVRDLDIVKKTEEFDEQWEEALYRICYSIPRYRSRVADISKLLNYLKDDLLESYGQDQLSQIISEIIRNTAVTSVNATDETFSNNTRPHTRKLYVDQEEGRNVYFEYNKFNVPKYERLTNFFKHVDDDLKDKFSYQHLYSKTQGASIYFDYGNNNKSKIGTMKITHECFYLRLYRDPTRDYRKPIIGDFKSVNVSRNNLLKLIEWYGLLIPTIEDYEKHKEAIYGLIELSEKVYVMRKTDDKYKLEKKFKKGNRVCTNEKLVKYFSDDHTYVVE